MAQETVTVSTVKQQSVAMVQIGLFDRGTAVKELVANAIALRENAKKDKNKKVVKNALGEPVITSRVVTLLPRKSESKEDLADLTGLEGQALMAFEMEARQQLMEASFSHMAKLIASGNYTFDRARVAANGKFALAIKPAIGKAAILSEEELKKQAEALGFTLMPKEGVELEVAPTTEQSAEAPAAKAKATAKKKTASTKPAVIPVAATVTQQ